MIDDEEKIVNLARSRDEQAFSTLTSAYGPEVFRLARYLLGSREEAQDAAAEVFARLYQIAERIPREGFRPWLMRVTYNLCHDILRRRQTLKRLLPRIYDHQSGREESAINQLVESDRKMVVQQALLRLPEHERAAVVLRYYHQLNYEEIAEIMGTRAATVGTWLHRGKEKLKNMLDKEMG